MKTVTHNSINEMQYALESAIKNHEALAILGNFHATLNGDMDQIFLTWEINSEEWPEDWCSDEPFSKEGGNQIIKESLLGEPDDSGIDSFIDKYGDDVIQHWVMWRVQNDQ